MNRILRTIILFVAIVTAINTIYADGIAGADRYVTLKPGATEYETITLDVQGGGADCCYQWTTSDGIILSDADKRSITIRPVSPQSTFRVTRACSSGTESGEVTVYAEEDFEIVSIFPKYSCYAAGDKVKTDDYDIVTSPKGFEKSVENITPIYSSPWLVYNQAVHAMDVEFCKSTDKSKTYKSHAIVVDESIGTDQSIGLDAEWVNLLFFKVNNISGKLIEAYNKYLSNAGPLMCDIQEPKLMLNIQGSDRKLCCRNALNYGIIKEVENMNGNLDFSFGYGCDYALVGFPYLASLNVRLESTLSTTLGISVDQKCEGKEVCVPVSICLSVGGGGSATVLGGAALDASVLLVGTGCIADGKLCLYPKPRAELGALCFDLKLKASINLMSLISGSYEMTLIPQKCVFTGN